jgi:hypothetical protein
VNKICDEYYCKYLKGHRRLEHEVYTELFNCSEFFYLSRCEKSIQQETCIIIKNSSTKIHYNSYFYQYKVSSVLINVCKIKIVVIGIHGNLTKFLVADDRCFFK